MIVVMKMGVSEEEIEGVVARIRELGFAPHLSRGEERTIIGVVGDDRRFAEEGMFEALPGVAECVRILKPFKLASRDFVAGRTVVKVGVGPQAVAVGGKEIVVAAGPCAVESWEQVEEVATAAKASGAVNTSQLSSSSWKSSAPASSTAFISFSSSAFAFSTTM